MIAIFLIDQRLYFGMAFQTFTIGNLVPELMALGTLAHALKIGMCIGKVARGNLAIADQGAQQKKVTNMSKEIIQAI